MHNLPASNAWTNEMRDVKKEAKKMDNPLEDEERPKYFVNLFDKVKLSFVLL